MIFGFSILKTKPGYNSGFVFLKKNILTKVFSLLFANCAKGLAFRLSIKISCFLHLDSCF